MTPPKKSLMQIRAEREQRCAEMRAMLDQGKSKATVAALFGITHQRVSQLVGKRREVFPRIVANLIDENQKFYLEVQMPNGKKFLADSEDLEKFGQFAWRTRLNGPTCTLYVVCTVVALVDGKHKTTTLQLARVIKGLGRDDPRVVDHANGDTLDNRKANLRICTNAENLRNRRKERNSTSGFKGAYPSGKKWISRICYNGKTYQLGRFDTPEEAHAAYCGAATRLHGEFANFG